MTETLDPRVERLFERASAAPDAEREAIVREGAGGDARLEREVRALLAAHETAGDFLLEPAVRALPEPREIAGRFRVVRTIGAGAMGTVYLAEQLAPVRRTVALKVVRAGLAGAGTLRRFDTERQSVARMSHEGIAKLFDSGTTEDGRPWFAMEYVAGEAITSFCAARELSLFARVWLVIAICRAVHHAHKKGVIHRDLKPSNVLVAEEDGRPVPKVIDFGVAKAAACPLDAGANETGDGELVGTLEYMSPEQALGADGGVDQRADVYAIGAILYELVTGDQPLPIRAARTQGLDAVSRVLREVEPQAPSARLASLAAADPARRTRLRAEARRVVGDLDWIVLAAVERDRARRYRSAAALADDLERFLRREPVSVAPPGRLYRLRKFERRHRAAVLTGAAVFASLLVGLAIALTQAHEAARQRDAAVAAAAETRQALQDLTFFLAALVHKTHEQLSEVPGATHARHDFARWAVESSESLAARPEVADQIHAFLGYAKQRLGEAEAVLGRPQEALEWFTSSLEHRELDAKLHPGTATRRTLAVGHWKAAQGAAGVGDFAGAERHHREALAVLEALHAERALAPGEDETYVGIAEERVAWSLALLDRDAEALETFDRALATMERGLAAWPDHGPLRQRRILAWLGSARLQTQRGRLDDGGARLDAAEHELASLASLALPLEVWEPAQRARLALARSELATARGDKDAAVAAARAAVEIARELSGRDRENQESRLLLAEAQSALGGALVDVGRAAEAQETLRGAATELEAIHARAPEHAAALREHALVCGRLGEAFGGTTEAGTAWRRRAAELVEDLQRSGRLAPVDRARLAKLRAAASGG